MDMALIQGAIGGLKTAADIATGLGGLKSMAEVQGKAVELQQVILSVQSNALAAHSAQFELLNRLRALEKEVADIKAWSEEKQRYALVACESGGVVYALKRESSNSEPPHWICANCFLVGRKSFLNDLTLTSKTGPHKLVLDCVNCKSQIDTGYAGGRVERKFAEDMK